MAGLAVRRPTSSELRELAVEPVRRFPRSLQTSVVAHSPYVELRYGPGSLGGLEQPKGMRSPSPSSQRCEHRPSLGVMLSPGELELRHEQGSDFLGARQDPWRRSAAPRFTAHWFPKQHRRSRPDSRATALVLEQSPEGLPCGPST